MGDVTQYITDLDNIRSGAAAGAAASAALGSYLTQSAASELYLTQSAADSRYLQSGDYLTRSTADSIYITNPELPTTAGDYTLVLNLNDNGVYTYSWKSGTVNAGTGGSSSGGSSDECDPNWEICD